MDNRENRRIERPFTIQFCPADAYPQKWDMSTIQNISAGGLRFTVANDTELLNKIIHVRIRIPEITHILEMQAYVLELLPRANTRFFDVRAKFINLSETNKKDLIFLERIIYPNAPH